MSADEALARFRAGPPVGSRHDYVRDGAWACAREGADEADTLAAALEWLPPDRGREAEAAVRSAYRKAPAAHGRGRRPQPGSAPKGGGVPRPAAPPAPEAQAPAPEPPDRARQAARASAAMLFEERSVPAGGTLAHAFLAKRGAWPPRRTPGAPALPPCVGWIAGRDWPAPGDWPRALDWPVPDGEGEAPKPGPRYTRRLPDGTAGAIVYAFAPFLEMGGGPAFVWARAVAPDGGGVPWPMGGGRSVKILAFGAMLPGAYVWLRDAAPDADAHLFEGVEDGLAWRARVEPWGAGAVLAGGKPGLGLAHALDGLPPPPVRIVIHPDFDASGGGQGSAARLYGVLRAAGRRVRVEGRPPLPRGAKADWNSRVAAELAALGAGADPGEADRGREVWAGWLADAKAKGGTA